VILSLPPTDSTVSGRNRITMRPTYQGKRQRCPGIDSMDLVGGNFSISALRMFSSNHRELWSTKTVAEPMASCPPASSATRGSRRTAEAFEV